MYVGVRPPPPRDGRKGSPSPNPPPGTATKEGEGGVGQMGFRAKPPPAEQFSSRPCAAPGQHMGPGVEDPERQFTTAVGDPPTTVGYPPTVVDYGFAALDCS